ncbi:MAG: hypothetical protein ABIR68_10685 [Ilumatobacteraceae bacterium]
MPLHGTRRDARPRRRPRGSDATALPADLVDGFGSSLDVAFGAAVRAGEELLATGTSSFVDGAIRFQRITAMRPARG